MKIKTSVGDKIFTCVNGFLLIFLALICLAPFVHLFAVSFSSARAATQGIVSFWPIGFQVNSYKEALAGQGFLRSVFNSLVRVVLGVSINIFLLIVTAYPLSRTKQQFPGRAIFSWFFIITMLVAGGMVPGYLMNVWTGIIDTIWVLVLPGAITAYNLTVMLNFYRNIPKGLEESALIDGASQLRVLFSIFVPLSKPIIATMIVFCTVGHWNEWFTALINMNSSEKYPLMTYLQVAIAKPNTEYSDMVDLENLMKVTSKTYQAAQIMITTLPILVIYPICQRHFVKGMTLGSMKG